MFVSLYVCLCYTISYHIISYYAILSYATLGAPPLPSGDQNEAHARLGWRYLSNATCLRRPHFVLCAFRRVWDHHNLPHYSPPLKETRVRQVVFDKWFPPRDTLFGAHALDASVRMPVRRRRRRRTMPWHAVPRRVALPRRGEVLQATSHVPDHVVPDDTLRAARRAKAGGLWSGWPKIIGGHRPRDRRKRTRASQSFPGHSGPPLFRGGPAGETSAGFQVWAPAQGSPV